MSLSNNSYKKKFCLNLLLRVFVWCQSFLHTEITRADKALGEIFDWRKTPAQDVYKRYFGKFTQHINQQSWASFFQLVFQNLNLNYFTLDIDSSVITRYGEQEGAKKATIPKKKEEASHHPIIAFVNDVKMVANF